MDLRAFKYQVDAAPIDAPAVAATRYLTWLVGEDAHLIFLAKAPDRCLEVYTAPTTHCVHRYTVQQSINCKSFIIGTFGAGHYS